MNTFLIKTRRNGEYMFNLKASNGEVILTSEGYTTRDSCLNGMASVRMNSIDDSLYERKTSTNGKHYFNLKAANGRVIGTSEMYENRSSMEAGISLVKRNARVAGVRDES